MYPGVSQFYLDRLEVCTNYGFISGIQIVGMVISSAAFDKMLTDDEFDVILDKADSIRIKLMEVNYNEQWQ